MLESLRIRLKADPQIWTANLMILVCSTFMNRLGQGVITAANTNFYVNVLGISSSQVLWLTGIREIPGLTLMFIAALFMRLPLARRAAVSVLIMGVGYALFALVHSYSGLIVAALISSLGFHHYMPLESSLGLSLSPKGKAGRVLGTMQSMGALASITGMGLIALLSVVLPLRAFFVFGGLSICLAAVLISRLPSNLGEQKKESRILLKKRYWLYYVLTFFEGSRMQVFSAFGTLILVQNYGLDARQISLLLVASSVVNFIIVPRLGRMLDGVGERLTLSTSYVALALCFVGYATVHNVWFLAGMLVCINLLVTLSIGLSTYVHRIAPPEELTPTLSAGVSVNHITLGVDVAPCRDAPAYRGL